MTDPAWRDAFLRLAPAVSLKRLEEPYLYHVVRDELYELDDTALAFLARCDGSQPGRDLTNDSDFVAYCLAEGLIEARAEPGRVPVTVGHGPTPSLRYLELQLLHRCNLRCLHCYLGPPRPTELPVEAALAISGEFAANGGLRLVISGGEPLLYPHLREFIEKTCGLGLRRIILTNGTLISADTARRLGVEELQVSLDGWQHGHDLLRGEGTFARTVAGIRAAREAGIPVGLATLVHRSNLAEFDELARFAEEIGAVEWGVDVLCMKGALTGHRDLLVPNAEAAPLLSYGYGGGYHGSGEGFACGRHLMTVLPDGQAVKCGFYEDEPLGDARAGLIDCWRGLRHIPLDELECRGCPVIDECAGGCRFRARHPLAPDGVMCAVYGMPPSTARPRGQ
jgi:radical SAM protein with 4Fe4S-binding SPASM domain